MNPLVDEFFKRDLTEREEEGLASSLAASPEESEALARGLAEMYQKSGLPEPAWPGGAPPFPGPPTAWGRVLLPASLILGLLAFSAYKWSSFRPTDPVPVQPALPAPEQAPVQRSAPIPRQQGKVDRSEEGFVNRSVPTGGTAYTSALPPAGPTAAQPPAPGRLVEELSVVVDPASPSLATVRVLDGSGAEVRTLYAGVLPAGRRTFTWDGKKDDGTLAHPGPYLIEVRSGDKVMRKEVKVEEIN